MSRTERANYNNFLCDTWWYGLTSRLSDQGFEDLARLRVRQGFTVVQLVVGVPPEVGPENSNASSRVGPAWNLKGEFNQNYLEYARQKIKSLNSLGLSALVYGAWGQQIEWLGEKRTQEWWGEIVKKVDDLEVMYCITGESDIWIGEDKKLLPGKSTDELNTARLTPFLHPRLAYLGKRLISLINEPLVKSKKDERRGKWSRVLAHVSLITDKPIFMHVLPGRTSEDAVNNPELLSAITVQTGHDPNARKLLWQLPLETMQRGPQSRFVNLEPWYEGITGRFGKEDQLYAYWASMMAGAHAYCYGAHGIWNVGDGKFLSHWGKQTLFQAMRLESPQLIGISHKLFIGSGFGDYLKVEVEEKAGELVQITRFNKQGRSVSYIPDISLVKTLPTGKIFLPTQGRFTETRPISGQLVIVSGL